MSYFDYKMMDLAQRRATVVRRRSEARYRLYWSTVARQVTVPRRKSNDWMRVRRLLNALQRWSRERVRSDVQIGEEGARTPALISKQG